jgi:hypothetical protein
MNKPIIKILAVSNVYCRLMNFVKAGDVENGHCHIFDHGTLLSTGKVLVEMFDNKDRVTASSIHEAPSFIFIAKDTKHRITALEDNTVAACIHAIRDVDQDLIDPSYFVNQIELADNLKESTAEKPILNDVVKAGFINKPNIVKVFRNF